MKHKFLSRRETQVLLAMALGLKIKDIAEVTGLDSKTVSTYFLRIQKKRGTIGLNHYAVVKDAIESLDEPPKLRVLEMYEETILHMQNSRKEHYKAELVNSRIFTKHNQR